MKAVIWTKYGPPSVLVLADVGKPAPLDHEALVRIHATTVFAGDCEVRNLRIPILYRLPLRLYVGVRKPKRISILGQELAGVIESVGADVRQFKAGDHVVASAGLAMGAYAEYICLREDGVLAIKPAHMTFEEAAAVPTGGLEALHFIRRARIQKGESVLINGAGGSIGTFAVQLAKAEGAVVTAVDSQEKLRMLRSIGADHTVDYVQEDFAKNGEAYDVILDVPGKRSFSGVAKSLKPNGRYLSANAGLLQMLQGRWASKRDGRQAIFGSAHPTAVDLVHLTSLIEAGVLRSVIDRCFPLEQIVQAHQYVESGRKQGNVAITVRPI